MSVEINWQRLCEDQQLNNKIKTLLDDQLQNIELPQFIKDIKVSDFYIGKTAPKITLRHIGEPFDEFYEEDEDEEVRESTPVEQNKDKDLQIIAEVEYRGDLFIEITTNLLLNYPSASFIELPIKLNITDLIIHSLAIVSFVNGLVHFSFLCDISDENLHSFIKQRSGSNGSVTPVSAGISPNNSTSRFVSKERIDIIKDLKIDSEIGGGTYGNQSSGSVLKNVGKVEKFLVEKIRSILRDEIGWPGWISFDFREDEEDVNAEENKQS